MCLTSALITGALFTGLCLWSASSYAQLNMGISAGEDQVSASRLRSALWLQTGISAGTLQFQSREASLKARVDALPVLLIGGDLWGSESYGLSFNTELGLGSDLDIPILADGQTLSYNHNHSLISGRHRWHLSPRDDAPALSLGFGLRWVTEDVPPQRPTYFVDRLALGPSLLLGFDMPLTDQLSLAIGAAYSRHLIVREDPADSGEPGGSSLISTQAQLSFMFNELIGVVAQGRYRLETVDFNGFGTRASGVNSGQADRSFWGVTIGAQLALK